MFDSNLQPGSIRFSIGKLAKWLCFSIAVFLSFGQANLFGSDTTERLQTAVARMNDWLGSGEDARAWRQILNLNVLDSQVALGNQADVNTLRSILNRFDSVDDSLKHPIFEEVNGAIRAHLAQLNRSLSGELADLQFAASNAVSVFRLPSVAKLEYDRDVAKYELQMLKRTYRRDLDSQKRGKLFHQLQLNDSIELLDSIEIEMPPEVSVGKMGSMINDERKRLSEIVDKIDAMPISPSEDVEDESDEDDLQNIIELSPPQPDDEDDEDLESLEKRKKTLQERISDLREKRREIFEKDKPRLRQRRDNVRALRLAQIRFRKQARTQMDPAFVSARKALDRFADEYEFATEDNIQEEYIEKVTELAELIPGLIRPTDRLSHAKLGQVLNWLEDRQQLTDLCIAVRRKHSSPNAYVSVSSRLVQMLAGQSSSEIDRVNEDFLGRIAKGWSYTNTNVTVNPIPDPNQARVSISVKGTASTDTYVRERSFRINSSASGYLSGRRDLFANLNGLFASESSVDASMSAQYGGISTSIGFIQKLAAKSFAKEKGRTDQESSLRAKNRLKERFDSETSKVIADGIDQIETLAEKARQFYALIPPAYLRSFSDRIEVVAKKETRAAVAATVSPGFRSAGSDVQIKLHESMISNYLDPIFAGREFTKADLENEIKSIAGDSNDLFGGGGDEVEVEDFKISFPQTRPVQIVFDDNRLTVVITGSKFEQGDNSIETTLTIKLSFKVISRNGKLILEPQGNPEINLSEEEEPSAESIAFARILEKKLAEAAEASTENEIELPANLIPPVDALKEVELVKSLQLGLFEMNDGWIYLGWNYQGGVVSTPAIWSELVINNFDQQYLPERLPELDGQMQPIEGEMTLPPLEDGSTSLPMGQPILIDGVVVETEIQR